MDKLILYFQENLILLYVTAIVLLVCAMVIALVIVLRKKRLNKALRDEELKNAAESLLNLPRTDAEKAIFQNDDLVKDNQASAETNNDTETTREKPVEINAIKSANTQNNEKKSAYKPENDDFSKSEEVKSNKAPCDKPNKNPTCDTAKKSSKQEETALTLDTTTEVKTENKPFETSKSDNDNAKKPVTDSKQNDNAVKQNKEKEKFRPTRANYSAAQKPDGEKPVVKYAGKWLIYVEDGKYAANLVASNGEVLLRSESYTALSGVKSGIETIKNNVAKNNFAISLDKNGNFFFKLYSSSTRLLCVSEGYSAKAVCESAVESVKRFAKTAVIEIKKDEN